MGDFDSLFASGWLSEVIGSLEELATDNHSAYRQNFPPMNSILDEDSGELTLEFALAGYSADELDVTVSGDSLRIKGTIKTAEAMNGKKIIKRGIKASDFEAKYTLPVGKFNTEETKVSLKDGLLKIKLPAAPSRKPIKISIE